MDFRSPDRDAVLNHAEEAFGDQPEYLWMKFPRDAVLRHRDNAKWYALVLEVPRCKVGLEGEGMVDILDVKCDPILIGSLLHERGFRPAYHMYKAYWITILLDGSLPEDQVFDLLHLSFELTRKKR